MESSAVNKENKSLYAPSQIHAERILRHDGRPIIYQCLEIANRASKMTKYNSQKESYCYGITSCSQCQSGPCNAGSVCWYISAFWVVTHESHKTIIISNIQTVHGEKRWRTLRGVGDWTCYAGFNWNRKMFLRESYWPFTFHISWWSRSSVLKDFHYKSTD